MSAKIRNDRIAVTRPNWARDVGVEYTFKTRVFTSRDGTETREALRQSARVALKFSTTLTRPKMARHVADLRKGLDVPFGVLADWLPAYTASAVTAGAATIPVEETPLWLVAGCQIIVTTGTHEDLFTVDSVASDTVTISGTTSVDYPARTRVSLAYTARLADKVEFSAETTGVWTGNVRYDAVPGTGQETYGAAGADTFEGEEILLLRPNWSDRPRITFLQEREEFDPGMGRNLVSAPEQADHFSARYNFTGITATKADTLISFFMRHRGRRNSFWCPIWARDIEPSATSTGSALTFQVDGSDFRDAYDAHPVYQAMIAIWDDGTWQANRVTAITGTTDSIVEFGAAWDQDITPDTNILWLLNCRFESDVLDVRWLTDTVCETSLPVRSLFAPAGA